MSTELYEAMDSNGVRDEAAYPATVLRRRGLQNDLPQYLVRYGNAVNM